jgi:hypothetical protein
MMRNIQRSLLAVLGFLILASGLWAQEADGSYHWENLPGKSASAYLDAAQAQLSKFNKMFSKRDVKKILAGELVRVEIGGNVAVIFVNKTIVDVEVRTVNAGGFLQDAEKIYGTPTESKVLTWQNGYGATWTTLHARWALSNGVIFNFDEDATFSATSGTANFRTPERQKAIDNITHRPNNL